MLAEVYFNLPFVPAGLLLVSGILLGYALWFTFREDMTAPAAHAVDLISRNQELTTALKEQQDAYTGLEQKHQKLNTELVALRQSRLRIDDAEHTLESSRPSLAVAEPLSALQAAYDDLTARYEAMERELIEARHAQDDAKSELEQWRRTAEEKSQAALVSQQLADSYSTLKEELVRKLQTLETQLIQQDADQRTWADRYLAMESQYHELARQKSQLERMIDEFKQDRDGSAERIQAQRQTIEQLRALVDDQARTLQADTATASEVMELRDQLHYTQRALDQARSELAANLSAHLLGTQQLSQAARQIAALKEDLQNYQRTLEAVGRSHEKALARGGRCERPPEELDQRLRDHEHTIETLRASLIDSHAIQDKCVSLQCTIRDQAEELRAIRIDRDEIASQLAVEKARWEQMQDRIGGYQQTIDQLREQREELLEGLNQARADRLVFQQTAQSGRHGLIGEAQSAHVMFGALVPVEDARRVSKEDSCTSPGQGRGGDSPVHDTTDDRAA